MKDQVKCSICKQDVEPNSIAKVMLSGPKVFDLLTCAHCGVTFFSPLPTKEELSHHYSSDYSFYKGDNFKAQGRGMAFAKKYLGFKKEGNFLDIGCASGDFLAGIKQGSQWNAFGTDINPEVVASVRDKLQLDIRAGEIEDIKFDSNFFDFIHVHDILEHVPSPVQFLKECRRIISDKGTLYLSVPNGLADAQNLIDYSAMHGEPAFSGAGHIYFFPFSSLELIFKDTGFRIEKVYSYNFKKGLRSFALLPKSRHWKRDLTPPISSDSAAKSEAPSRNQKRRSTTYYKFQFFKDALTQVSGAHKYGQDFILVLKPC